MTASEMKQEFDLLYDNITSSQSPGLEEEEISVFLNKAQNQIVVEYFNPMTDGTDAGFDNTPKRQVDFSTLTKSTYLERKTPDISKKFDTRSLVYEWPKDLLIPIDEQLGEEDPRDPTDFSKLKAGYDPDKDTFYTVIPISYIEYSKLMSKPYKYPPRGQAWRIITGDIGINDDEEPDTSAISTKTSEVTDTQESEEVGETSTTESTNTYEDTEIEEPKIETNTETTKEPYKVSEAISSSVTVPIFENKSYNLVATITVTGTSALTFAVGDSNWTASGVRTNFPSIIIRTIPNTVNNVRTLVNYIIQEIQALNLGLTVTSNVLDGTPGLIDISWQSDGGVCYWFINKPSIQYEGEFPSITNTTTTTINNNTIRTVTNTITKTVTKPVIKTVTINTVKTVTTTINATVNRGVKYVEIIGKFPDNIKPEGTGLPVYRMRYIRIPDRISIENNIGCKLPEILHHNIVERAVYLAKLAWQGYTMEQAQQVAAQQEK